MKTTKVPGYSTWERLGVALQAYALNSGTLSLPEKEKVSSHDTFPKKTGKEKFRKVVYT